MARAAAPRSAPGSTTAGHLPPSSRVSGVRLSAAARITSRPIRVPPVNTRWSQGCAANAAATSGPPCTTRATPGPSASAAISASSAAVRGVASAGFSATRLPAASASTAGRRASCTG